MIFAASKADYFLLLWIIPFLIFLYFIGWVLIYHLIPLIPALCIAAARLIVDLPKKTKKQEASATNTLHYNLNNSNFWDSKDFYIINSKY
jgi:4-hydroxybenzoate polyprenyltransferase